MSGAVDYSRVGERCKTARMSDDSAHSTQRFSSRVDAYVKYRPSYPPGVYELFRQELGIGRGSTVADVGSGTGISAEPLLRDGVIVYCVEPNADMRGAAERSLSRYPGFRSITGTGEHTSLPGHSVDLVICAQAFHWLDHQAAADEFRRVTRPGGFVAILWNRRRTDSSPFLQEYDQLLTRYGTDYVKVSYEKEPLSPGEFEALFDVPFAKITFPNEQRFDLTGLRGRVASSSYVPLPGEPGYPELYAGLDDLFTRHASTGRITFEYETEVYYADFISKSSQG